MLFIVIPLALILLSLISLSVFGSGLVYISAFQWEWHLLREYFPNLNEDTFDLAIITANSTPGIFSPKIAFFTGWLMSNNVGISLIFGTLMYIFFVVPSIWILFVALRLVKRMPAHKRIMRNLIPVISGITLAIAISMYMKSFLPWIQFNQREGYFRFMGFSNSSVADTPESFFTKWRGIVLLLWGPISVAVSYYLIRRRRTSAILIIFISTALSFIIFQPWLMQ